MDNSFRVFISYAHNDFDSKLDLINFEKLILPQPGLLFGTTIIAVWSGERSKAISDYAETLAELGEYGLVGSQSNMNDTGQTVEIALSEQARETNLVIVGNHFYAESMAAKG